MRNDSNRIMQKTVMVEHLSQRLSSFQEFPLDGIHSYETRHTLALQLLDSIRRVEFVRSISQKSFSEQRTNPASSLFDPLKAAVIHRNNGNFEEAIWLVFLITIFGKSKKSKWTICQDIYGALGQRSPWTWEEVSNDFGGFVDWFRQASQLMSKDSITRKFGGHRQYESLRYDAKKRPLQLIVRSYIDWVGGHKNQVTRFELAKLENDGDPKAVFGYLYNSLNAVVSFGRLSKFDFLTMLSKLNLIEAYPPFAYLKGATGPLRGVNLLFCNDVGQREDFSKLEEKLGLLGEHLQLGDFSKQILEDALCNWQKSPTVYSYFAG